MTTPGSGCNALEERRENFLMAIGCSTIALAQGIEDNSFFIEEAYNQDPRVVQHAEEICLFDTKWCRGGAPDGEALIGPADIQIAGGSQTVAKNTHFITGVERVSCVHFLFSQRPHKNVAEIPIRAYFPIRNIPRPV